MSYQTPKEPQAPSVIFAALVLAACFALCFWPQALRFSLQWLRPMLELPVDGKKQ